MTPADVKTVIEAEDDFGHEMRVGYEFQKAVAGIPNQWSANITELKHGETYIDPITNKDRQFDFRCQIRLSKPHLSNRCWVLLAVECKNLHKSSPLVVCGRDRTSEEAYHTFVESTGDKNVTFPPEAYKVKGSRFYPADSFVGKSLVRLKNERGQFRTDTQADVYDRWSQAVTSAKEMARKAGVFANEHERQRHRSFILPIVVVPNGLLWKATYDSTGEIKGEPTLVEECQFFIAARSDLGGNLPFVLTHIHFVTIKGFATLLTGLLNNPDEKKDVFFPINTEPLQSQNVLMSL